VNSRECRIGTRAEGRGIVANDRADPVPRGGDWNPSTQSENPRISVGPYVFHAQWTCPISSRPSLDSDVDMAPKYSHIKKRGVAPPSTTTSSKKQTTKQDNKKPSPHTDRNISQAMTAVAQLERAISRILLIRYEQDMARLFSTHLYSVALCHLPSLVMRCTTLGGPGWVAVNADGEEIKEFFRSVIAMDLREAGERVATKSVLWSYTALRQFVSVDLRSPIAPMHAHF